MNEPISISGTNHKVLVLEDSPFDLELIEELLTGAGYVLDLTHAENEVDFSAALLEKKFDIILSDFSLPGFNAFGALEIRNKLCRDVPFICISGSIGEETAIELLKLGAVDYVLKDRPERLPFSVQRALDEAKETIAYKKAVKDLQESKARFEQVAEDAQEWIWEVDQKGIYTYASPVVKSLLGYAAEELVGKKYFYDFFTPDVQKELRDTALDMFSKRLSFRHFQNSNLHKDGHVLILTTSGSPIFDNEGNFEGYRGVDADMTERYKMLEELVAAKEKAEESDKLKTAFINNISHEIRTPLNSILGFGKFLSENELSKEQRSDYFKIIENSSNRLINTVSDYIDMARIVSGTMLDHRENFLIEPFFLDTVEVHKQDCIDKKIDFQIEIPTCQDGLTIHSDPSFIGKILHILLDNAVKFTANGSIRCGYTIEPGFLEFYVRDTGCGIASEKLEEIFDMFSQEDLSNTRGYEGSGLGLSIAKGLIKLIGGTVGVSSEKGMGSFFSFTIPTSISYDGDIPEINGHMSSIETIRPLILIAEDDESNFLYLKVLMNMVGCDFVRAVNGADAVECCSQNKGITMVLMDIKMPIMNGIEATQRIHSFRPELPIIATTAYAQSGDEHRFLSAGCNGYLPKPINKDNLLQLVKRFSKIPS